MVVLLGLSIVISFVGSLSIDRVIPQYGPMLRYCDVFGSTSVAPATCLTRRQHPRQCGCRSCWASGCSATYAAGPARSARLLTRAVWPQLVIFRMLRLYFIFVLRRGAIVSLSLWSFGLLFLYPVRARPVGALRLTRSLGGSC